MYALLIALIVVLFAMVKTKEHLILKVGDPRKDQDIIGFDFKKPGYRVAALTPDTCPSGFDIDAGLCYPPCDPGFKGIGPMCWAETVSVGVGKPVGLEPCPRGWTNDGLICREPLRWNNCKFRGLFNECWPGAEGGRLQGRLNNGGICDWPDKSELPGWLQENGKATHPDRVTGLCYKKCPPEKPNRVPGMPYLCMKGDRLSYGRGVGTIPPIFAYGSG